MHDKKSAKQRAYLKKNVRNLLADVLFPSLEE